jgi:hypothetical protein
MQEGNVEPRLRTRPGSNNVTFDGKQLDGVFGMHRSDGDHITLLFALIRLARMGRDSWAFLDPEIVAVIALN